MPERTVIGMRKPNRLQSALQQEKRLVNKKSFKNSRKKDRDVTTR